jgi:hypothetical protein
MLAAVPIAAAATICDAGKAAQILCSVAGRVRPQAAIGPSRSEESWNGDRNVRIAPAVFLSVEAIGRISEPNEDATVVFPGYLLPDDSHEEASHEGS